MVGLNFGISMRDMGKYLCIKCGEAFRTEPGHPYDGFEIWYSILIIKLLCDKCEEESLNTIGAV